MTQLPDTTTEKGQREASRMLARLIPEWEVTNDWQITTPEGYGLRNLYKPSEMAQAWKVLVWVRDYYKASGHYGQIYDFIHGWTNNDVPIYAMPPADAQRAWLDKILELAIEGGLLEAQP